MYTIDLYKDILCDQNFIRHEKNAVKILSASYENDSFSLGPSELLKNWLVENNMDFSFEKVYHKPYSDSKSDCGIQSIQIHFKEENDYTNFCLTWK